MEARARCSHYRRRILDISQQVQALHIGSAYSCTEMVDTIYHGLMRHDPDGTSPDTFLMSKGHGCMILYVILEDRGVLSREDLDLYCKPNGRLGCHPDYGNPGIEASTGALGHGLSMAVGMALAERARKTRGIIYTVLSDGEVQEGSTWEAILMASSFGLSNLVAFVDTATRTVTCWPGVTSTEQVSGTVRPFIFVWYGLLLVVLSMKYWLFVL